MILKCKTLGPIFIGSGNKLSSMEYSVNQNEKTLSVYDFEKFLKVCEKESKLETVEKFIESNKRVSFSEILHASNISKKEGFKLFQFDNFEGKGGANINLFSGDLNNFFIPGSSLKGVLYHLLEIKDSDRKDSENDIFRDVYFDKDYVKKNFGIYKINNFMQNEKNNKNFYNSYGKRKNPSLEFCFCLKENSEFDFHLEDKKFITGENFHKINENMLKIIEFENQLLKRKRSQQTAGDLPYFLDSMKKQIEVMIQQRKQEAIIKIGKHTNWYNKVDFNKKYYNFTIDKIDEERFNEEKKTNSRLRSFRSLEDYKNRKGQKPIRRFGIGEKAYSFIEGNYESLPFGFLKIGLDEEND